MTKNEIMDYVTETPHNINKNILGQKLDQYANQSGGGNAVQYVPQELTEEQQMQARANMGLYRKDVIETLTCVYDYSHESNTQTTDGTKLYYVGDIGGDEGLYYITESNTNRTYAVQFEMCGSPYCYKGEFTTIEDADYVVYLTLKSGTWDSVTFPHDGPGVYVTAPLYSYEIYISKIEEARIYPVPEVYIPDTIARKSDIPASGGGGSGETSRIFNFRDVADITIENMQVGPGEYEDVEVFKLNVAKIPIGGGLMIKDVEVRTTVAFCDPDGNEITDVDGNDRFSNYVGAVLVSVGQNNLGYYKVVFGMPEGYTQINGLDGSYRVTNLKFAVNT